MRRFAGLLTVAGAVALGSCGDDLADSGAHAIIGPQGGSLVVDDPGSAIDGVTVTIPAGALARDANVSLRVRDDDSALPDMPAGLAVFGATLELGSDVPFDHDVQLSFPIRNVGNAVDRIPSGFRPDATGESWDAVLVDHLAGETFSIRTRAPGTWRWGFTLVDEVAPAVLRPAVAGVLGESALGQMEQAAQERFDELAGELANDEEAWSDCDTLAVVVDVIANVRAEMAADIEAALAQACGGCVITAGNFVDELREFLEAKMGHWLYDLLIEAAAPNFIIEILGKMAAYAYYQSVLDGLTCDFECLADHPPPGLWVDVGSFLVCDVALSFITIGVQYTDCPPLGP